jgi:uncharacterized coiled-coil protein SlyX
MIRQRSAEPISLRFVANWEQRVAKQKQLIAELKLRRRSTAQAEAELQQQLEVLAKLRNHAEVMQELTTPPPPERTISGHRTSVTIKKQPGLC